MATTLEGGGIEEMKIFHVLGIECRKRKKWTKTGQFAAAERSGRPGFMDSSPYKRAEECPHEYSVLKKCCERIFDTVRFWTR
jgi:hypothetical protein